MVGPWSSAAAFRPWPRRRRRKLPRRDRQRVGLELRSEHVGDAVRAQEVGVERRVQAVRAERRVRVRGPQAVDNRHREAGGGCIGRKTAITARGPPVPARSSVARRPPPRLVPGVAQPRRRRGQSERLAPEVVGRQEQDHALSCSALGRPGSGVGGPGSGSAVGVGVRSPVPGRRGRVSRFPSAGLCFAGQAIAFSVATIVPRSILPAEDSHMWSRRSFLRLAGSAAGAGWRQAVRDREVAALSPAMAGPHAGRGCGRRNLLA